jgi:hypothetical protein
MMLEVLCFKLKHLNYNLVGGCVYRKIRSGNIGDGGLSFPKNSIRPDSHDEAESAHIGTENLAVALAEPYAETSAAVPFHRLLNPP